MFKRWSHKFLLPCPSSYFARTPFDVQPAPECIRLPLVKQHLFTSWRMLLSNPILLNRGSKEYSSSSTLAIKILVSPLLHCRRCYGATYRISSSEHGHFWPYTITYPGIGIRTPRQEKPLVATSSHFPPREKSTRPDQDEKSVGAPAPIFCSISLLHRSLIPLRPDLTIPRRPPPQHFIVVLLLRSLLVLLGTCQALDALLIP